MIKDDTQAAAEGGRMTDAGFPVTPDALLALLGTLSIPYRLYRHEAVFTVAESSAMDIDIPGCSCRNLFLKDKAGRQILICAAHETSIDLKSVPALAGTGRLSFGSPDRLWRALGVRPGSVCPFAVINDRAGSVTVFLDAFMMAHDIVNFHPLDNRMTIGLTPRDLIKFLDYAGHPPHIVDFGSREAP